MSTERDIVILTSVVEPEDDLFVSTCIELGTSSCGDTIQEAFENLEEAISVHLNALKEIGETERVFHERGIEILRAPIEESVPRPVPIDKVVKISQHPVPVPV